MDLFHLKFMINAMTFDIVNTPFLDDDVPLRASYGAYEGCSLILVICV